MSEDPSAGDVWVNRNVAWVSADWQPGGQGYSALLHELGHALGLKHPFEASANGYFLAPSLDDEAHTVMSYTSAPHSALLTVTGSQFSYSWQTSHLAPSTLMPLDIEALQHLYGANTSARSGNDVYSWAAGAELLETIWDGGGIDTIDARHQTFASVIDLAAGAWSSIGLRQSDAQIRLGLGLPSWFDAPLPADIYDGSNNLAIARGVVIENANGGAGADRITGNAVANVLNGLGGSDTIDGAAGNDVIDGGAGADTMIGGLGNDQFYVREAGDTVVEAAGGGGSDMVYSLLASYTLAAGVENGRILAGAPAGATLRGNELANVLFARDGNEVLAGGAGVDTVSYAAATAGVKVSLALATAQATGGSGSDTLAEFERLTGSGFNDTLTGSIANNLLNGGAGNDVIDGGAGNDTMVGGTGNDQYWVRQAGDSVVEADGGGADTVYSMLASYTLAAAIESGRILSGGGATLQGNALANVLRGGAGNDSLAGGDGNDVLVGGTGRDSLTGGNGSDVFDFDFLTEMGVTLNGTSTWDVITDFTTGDRIDLRTLDANAATVADEAFAFVGSAAFSAAGQLRFASGMLYGSTDGDVDAEFALQLAGVATLPAGSILL